MELTNKDNLTLDELLEDIKTGVESIEPEDLSEIDSINLVDDYQETESVSPEEVPKDVMKSVLSDPLKHIKKADIVDKADSADRVDKADIVDKAEEKKKKKQEYHDEMNRKTLQMISEQRISNPDLRDLDETYLKGREDTMGLKDEHPFMNKLDCKSRLQYCFTNKSISKKCFDKNDSLHQTYILPCKMRTELKKAINHINNQDIQEYLSNLDSRSEYLEKAVFRHIDRVLPLFSFEENEIKALLESGRDYDKKTNFFNSSIREEGDRGLYFGYLFKMFNKNQLLLHSIINRYIDILIIHYKYTEIDAINSAFKFLNTLAMNSDTFNSIEQYYLEEFRKFKREQRRLLYSSDSE